MYVCAHVHIKIRISAIAALLSRCRTAHQRTPIVVTSATVIARYHYQGKKKYMVRLKTLSFTAKGVFGLCQVSTNCMAVVEKRCSYNFIQGCCFLIGLEEW